MIRRRTMMTMTAAAGAATWLGGRAAAQGSTTFEVRTAIDLAATSGPAMIWLPLLQTAGGTQTVRSTTWNGSGHSALVRDDRYGAGILQTEWTDGAGPRTLELVQHVSVPATRGPAGPRSLSAAERQFWTAPTASAPTDGIVRDTAKKIVAGRRRERDQVRAIYDWVVDHTHRDAAVAGCGTGDVRAMLASGRFGGKCADINGLFVALTRAAGVPARDVYGIRLGPAALSASLGPKSAGFSKMADISKAQHCRAEVFLGGEGWFPVDPADVRKVVLEEALPTSDPHVERVREALFGHWEMNWAGYNSATDIVLPGAAGRRPDFAFLMYPCAFTTEGQPSCVDPGGFRYGITSVPVAA